MELFDRIDRILRHPEMSNAIAECLSLLPGRPGENEFDAMVARVEGKFENSRNYPVVLQFIQDHSKLRDDEIMRLFEFIYSSLVNKFKGELGEVLARPSMLAFLKMLPSGAELVSGPELASRQLRRRHGWYPAADAFFFVRSNDIFEVVAVAEVKSKATPLDELREQVAKHILRLRRGLRLRSEEIPPEAIRLRMADGRSTPIEHVDESVARTVTSLMIVPFKAASDHLPVPHPEHAHIWFAELPYGQDDITEAAYRFMSWYFGRIGPKVFYYRAEGDRPPDDRRRPAAHDHLSLEENGAHAFLEAIYFAALRKGFDPRERPPRGRRTPWQTLLWLYNSLGFGYENASTDEFMFPESKPSAESEARVARRDATVAHYRAGNFAAALVELPDPAEETDRWWLRREWVMLARIRARSGDASGAREALSRATSMPPIDSLSLPIEIAAVEVLIEIAAGDRSAAEAKLRHATTVVEEVRAQVRIHAEKNWDLPSDIEPNSAREGVIDLAVAYTALDNNEAAIDLLSRLRQLRGWELEFFASDAVLSRAAGEHQVLDLLRRVTSTRGELAVF